MTMPRRYLGGALGADGRIYAIGGETNGPRELPDVEAYSPAQDRWVPIAPLLGARSRLAAATGSDGRIYATGGQLGANFLQTVEVYGPAILATPDHGAVGAPIGVQGSNFAAHARVRIFVGPVLVAQATTDSAGALALTSVTVPVLASGMYVVHGVDARSQYPTSTPFRVE